MIDYKTIELINEFFCENSNEPVGVKDKSLLKSLSKAPFQTFSNVELYPTIEDKIAYTFGSIIKNHIFINAITVMSISISHIFGNRSYYLAIFFQYQNGIIVSIIPSCFMRKRIGTFFPLIPLEMLNT